MSRHLPILGLVALTLSLTGVACSRVYYNTMESFGVHKRDILVDRVEEARDEQEEAKEQFKTALESFREVVHFQGGELEARYKELNREYEESEAQAKAVHNRIRSVEDVAEALFREWESELEEYTSDDLRRRSEQKLNETRRLYTDVIYAMERAENKMYPVLNRFHDQVLYLKHNLNAMAIGELEEVEDSLQTEVDDLVAELERSIDEANEFIMEMGL